MTSPPTIGELFQESPTRDLEEVQKVETASDRVQAKRDIAEFIETGSAKDVVTALADRVDGVRPGRPRLLYLHATFGSGKSHLLKLVGIATGQVPGCEDLADQLAGQFLTFKTFREALQASAPDRWVPVFLNLLDRDPAADPPLPYLVYLALSRRLDYPTDPTWLAEWAWEVDGEAGLWPSILEAEHEGRSFQEVLARRARLRDWLQSVVPELSGAADIGLGTASAVGESIQAAEASLDPGRFDGSDLADRLENARAILEGRGQGDIQFLVGLDEVALFVGDSERRFREFRATVEALQTAEPPLLVATGQWSLASMARDFYDDVPEAWMEEGEVELRAADAEEIVRKRWLKKTKDGREAIEHTLDGLPEAVLQRGESGASPTEGATTYPFLPGDLQDFRRATEEVLTAGAETDRDFVQGRALLVYVRGLFTELGWADEPLGRLVTWDLLFDLLDTQGGYLPGWIGDLVEMARINLPGQAETAVRVVKALYMLDHVDEHPATIEAVARRLVTDVTDNPADVEDDVRQVMGALEEKHLVHPDQTAEDGTVYRLLSREEVSVSQKIRDQQVSQADVRVRLEQWLREHDYAASEDLKREVDLAGAREVPLRTRYSVLSLSMGSSPSAFDAVTLRFLVHHEDTEEAVDRWRSLHEERGRDGEDLLAVIELPQAFYEDLDRAIAMDRVLERETRRVKDLEAKARRKRNELHRRFQDLVSQASLYRPGKGQKVGQLDTEFEQLVVDRILPEKFPERKTLQRGLRPLDAARELTRFFDDEAEWPLAPEDAELLGVDLQARALEEDGWIERFLERWDESDYVEGEGDLLPRIEGPSGDFLGTPVETLQALVLVAAAAQRITVRQQGEPVLDPEGIASAVRTKTALEKLTFRPASPEEGPRSEEVEALYETLTGETVSDLSPAELLDRVGAWAHGGLGRIREVDRQLRRRTTADARLSALEEALEPAEAGEELREADLVADQVQKEAERYALARQYFGGELEDLWQELEAVAEVLREYYPGSTVGRRVDRCFATPDLPAPKSLRSLLTQAQETREERMRGVYERLFKQEPPDEPPDRLLERLREDLTVEADQLHEEIDALEGKLHDRLELPELRELLAEGTDGDPERFRERLESETLEAETRHLERARELTVQPDDEDSLWARLQEAEERLEVDHPDSPLREEVRDALAGPELPEPGRAKRLIEQAQQQPDTGTKVEDDHRVPETIQERLNELEDGAIVAVLKEHT